MTVRSPPARPIPAAISRPMVNRWNPTLVLAITTLSLSFESDRRCPQTSRRMFLHWPRKDVSRRTYHADCSMWYALMKAARATESPAPPQVGVPSCLSHYRQWGRWAARLWPGRSGRRRRGKRASGRRAGASDEGPRGPRGGAAGGRGRAAVERRVEAAPAADRGGAGGTGAAAPVSTGEPPCRASVSYTH